VVPAADLSSCGNRRPGPAGRGPPGLDSVPAALSPRHPQQRPIKVSGELREAAPGSRRCRPENQPAARGKPPQTILHQVAESAAHPVAHYGVAHTAGDYESHSGRRGNRPHRSEEVHDDRTACSASPLPDGEGELGSPAQPGSSRQHVVLPAQADSSARPLRRRAARIARPARVRMRSRNPWVLARRRLFGWNVRLLTCGLPAGGGGGARWAGRRDPRQNTPPVGFEPDRACWSGLVSTAACRGCPPAVSVDRRTSPAGGTSAT